MKTHKVYYARLALTEEAALKAAREGRPLPAGYKLPSIGEEMFSIYQALRSGETHEAIATVSAWAKSLSLS